ncbi:MAG TPA: ferritin-like domain-containing protein [Bacillota bacterium]|nr:ferritin-like domain-containing protein [Bacillota bacterium]
MKKEDLISRLNWFYSLELNQVDLYTAQSKTFAGSYESLVFERTAVIEQQHVDNIAAKIRELGGKPTKIGDVVSPILGKIAGELISYAGVENTLKANILIEQKAMQDYTDLINTVGAEYGTELKKILQHNLVDEDVHTAWFAGRLTDYDNSVLNDSP